MLKFLISFIFIGHIFAKDQLNIQIDQQADGIKVITIDFDSPKPKNLKCISIHQVKSDYTPMDILSAAKSCIKRNKTAQAIELFNLGYLYIQFDMQRVKDITAHQIVNIYIKEYQDFIQKQNISIKYYSKLEDLSQKSFCKKLNGLPHPTYAPKYMIQHGMNAMMLGIDPKVTKNPFEDALVNDFDAKKTWKLILARFSCKENDFALNENKLKKTLHAHQKELLKFGGKKLRCVSLSELKTTHTPVSIMISALNCVEEGQYHQAWELYFAGYLYILYDEKKLPVFSETPKKKLKVFNEYNRIWNKAMLSVEKNRHILFNNYMPIDCTFINDLKMPKYYPVYRVNLYQEINIVIPQNQYVRNHKIQSIMWKNSTQEFCEQFNKNRLIKD